MELHRNDQTKGNAVEDKSDHEESPKTDKQQGHYSLHSLIEKEKEQILQFSKQETLEEGIAYALRHMTKRCTEAGEEATPLIPLENLAYRFHNAYSTSATSHKIREGYVDESEEQIPNLQVSEFFSVQGILIMKVQQGHQNPHHLIKIIHLLPLQITVLLHLPHCLGHPSLMIQTSLVIAVAIQVVAKYYLQKQ